MVHKKPIRKGEHKIEAPKKGPSEEPKGGAAEAPHGEAATEEKPPSLVDMLSEFMQRKDAEDIEKYTTAVLSKFGRYIKSVVLWGSKKTKVKTRKTSDIDIAIIVDDTDVRRMTRSQLKDKLFQRLLEMGHPLSEKIHPQPYLLTEFWQYVMEGNPVIYNVLRDGIIIFDAGYFMPLQMLMRMGAVHPSKETVDKHIGIAEEILELAKNTMLSKLTYDLEQAIVASTQAVLMELGYRPPTPNDTARFVQKVLVEEHKLVDTRFTKIAETIVKNYKDVEHKEKKEFTGKEWDALLRDTEEYVDKMKELLKKIRKDRGETYLYESHEARKSGKKLELKRPTDIDMTKEETGKNEEQLKKEIGQG